MYQQDCGCGNILKEMYINMVNLEGLIIQIVPCFHGYLTIYILTLKYCCGYEILNEFVNTFCSSEHANYSPDFLKPY